MDEGEKCTSLFYVDAADISSFEIPYDEIAQLVEGGAIQVLHEQCFSAMLMLCIVFSERF